MTTKEDVPTTAKLQRFNTSRRPVEVPGEPPFDPHGSRYDLSTFKGRVQESYSTTDARTLFASRERIKKAQDLLELHEAGLMPVGTTTTELWEAKKLVGATLHPDTKEPVFPLFRFSAFAPVNVVITSIMLLPSTISSFPLTAGIHALNQSYNAAVNYSNRNASTETDVSRLVQGFGGAVAASVSIALGAAAVMRRVTAMNNPNMVTLVRSTLPFLAVSSAGCVNVLLMRRDEMSDGVSVLDEEGKVRGKSKIAGTDALMKCCAARFMWTVPGMIGPPAIMAMLANRIPSGPRFKFFAEVVVISMCLWIGVPPALAVFPQKDSLPVTQLEPEFQNLKLSSGAPVERLHFNKGL